MYCCAFDDSGSRLATGGQQDDNCVTVWNVATWTQTQTLPTDRLQTRVFARQPSDHNLRLSLNVGGPRSHWDSKSQASLLPETWKAPRRKLGPRLQQLIG